MKARSSRHGHETAALSSRSELYPRGMAAEQVLRLSLGSLAGARVLTTEQIRERAHGRYPDAEPPPERPDLDRLLADAGADRDWREDGDALGRRCWTEG